MKLLIVKKKLLSGGEDKFLPAVHASEYLVLEFHDPVDCRSAVSQRLHGCENGLDDRNRPPSSK
jgi:hypothetical protein